MGQSAHEQLATPFFADSMSTQFLFCLGSPDWSQRRKKELAKNGNRTLNYICEGRIDEHERAGRHRELLVLMFLALSCKQRVHLCTEVTALVPCAAFCCCRRVTLALSHWRIRLIPMPTYGTGQSISWCHCGSPLPQLPPDSSELLLKKLC